MALLSFAFLVTLLATAALASPFENCEAESPAIALDVSGCDSSPCVIVRGQPFSANLTFSVDHEVTVLEPSLIVRVDGAPDQSVTLSDNPCDQIPGGCPLKADSINVYSISVGVESTGYEGPFTAEFALSDDHEHNLVCVLVSGVLAAPPKKINAII